jgi:hypothetical protein
MAPRTTKASERLHQKGGLLGPSPSDPKEAESRIDTKNGITGPVYRTPLQKFDAGTVPGRRQAMERNTGVEMMHKVKILSQEQPGKPR